MRKYIDLSIDRSKIINSLGDGFRINLSYYQELFIMYNRKEKTRTTAYLNLLKELFIVCGNNIIYKYFNHSLIKLYKFEYLKNNIKIHIQPSITSFDKKKLNYTNLKKLVNEIKK